MNRFHTFLTISIFGLSFHITDLCHGQSERMTKLSDTYEVELKKVIEPVNKQYENALIKLQKQFIAQNRLEDALLVKKEIELLKENKITPAVAAVPQSTPTPTDSETPSSKIDTEWKGDLKVYQEDGETVFVLEGRKSGTRMMTMPIENIKERFPNGLRVRYQYRSSDFVGQGVETRMEFPDLRGLFTYRNPTLNFNGEWNEYLWPFSDTKDQDMMNFQVMLENGEGKVEFKNFELLPN